MTGPSYERGVVSELYPTRGWAKKVDKMSDAQIHAIYLKIVAQEKK